MCELFFERGDECRIARLQNFGGMIVCGESDLVSGVRAPVCIVRVLCAFLGMQGIMHATPIGLFNQKIVADPSHLQVIPHDLVDPANKRQKKFKIKKVCLTEKRQTYSDIVFVHLEVSSSKFRFLFRNGDICTSFRRESISIDTQESMIV